MKRLRYFLGIFIILFMLSQSVSLVSTTASHDDQSLEDQSASMQLNLPRDGFDPVFEPNDDGVDGMDGCVWVQGPDSRWYLICG